MFGYAGNWLEVDLTDRGIQSHPVDLDWLKTVIGGRMMNTWRMYEEMTTGVDPLSPENTVYVGVGPLTGTLLPASAYTTVSARSPLTGLIGDAAAGGHFGPELKFAGFDQVVIRGRSEEPCYLLITDESVEIRSASHLWGKDIRETHLALLKELRDPRIQVAAIGPAGENLVKYATIATNMAGRTFGRTGMGAVWGSKHLKAIAVRGRTPISVAHPQRFEAICRELNRRIIEHPEFETRKRVGTTMLVNNLNLLGILPTRHFQEGVCEYAHKINGEILRKRYVTKNKACYNCNVHCSRYIITPDGEGEGPEFEPLCSYTSRIGNADLRRALKVIMFMNRYGVDAISSGETIGWAMECIEKGLLDAADFDGIELRFGNMDAVEQILDLIVVRRGIGDLFAEGTRALAQQYGGSAEKLAMHTKGLEIINGDPRGLKAYGLGYAVASRGACHLRADPFFELTGRYNEAMKRFGTEKAAMPFEEEGKPALVEYSERNCLLLDALTMCKNVGQSMEIMNPDVGAELLQAGTGMTFDSEELSGILAETRTMERRLNLRFGLDPKDDTLPCRFKEEGLPAGPAAGQIIDVDAMVKEFYRIKGWSEEGIPPPD